MNVFCPFLPLTAGKAPMVSWFCLGEGSFWKPEVWGSLSLSQEALLRRWGLPWAVSWKPHGRVGWHLTSFLSNLRGADAPEF